MRIIKAKVNRLNKTTYPEGGNFFNVSHGLNEETSTTVCGAWHDEWDASTEEDMETITCPGCLEIINQCKQYTGLTKKEKIYKIKHLIGVRNNIGNILDKCEMLFGKPGGVLNPTLLDILDGVIELTEKELGDVDEYISWFIFDNDCGRNNLCVVVDDKETIISDVETLVRLVL